MASNEIYFCSSSDTKKLSLPVNNTLSYNPTNKYVSQFSNGCDGCFGCGYIQHRFRFFTRKHNKELRNMF